jgi:hypothetical protein
LSAATASVNSLPPDGSFTINTQSGCDWTAVSNAPWITIVTPAGSGSASISYHVTANDTGLPRTGTITVAGQTFTVDQSASCAYSITPPQTNFTAFGGAGAFTLSTSAGCSWNAASDSDWIVLANSSGTGTATISYNVAPNAELQDRTGHITTAGQSHTVTQAALKPDLTGYWSPLLISCRQTSNGTRCKGTAFFTLSNRGSQVQQPFVVRFYLSADDTLSTDDLLLKQWKLKKLSAGAMRIKKVRSRLPIELANVDLTWFAQVDADNGVPELDESNNVVATHAP